MKYLKDPNENILSLINVRRNAIRVSTTKESFKSKFNSWVIELFVERKIEFPGNSESSGTWNGVPDRIFEGNLRWRKYLQRDDVDDVLDEESQSLATEQCLPYT